MNTSCTHSYFRLKYADGRKDRTAVSFICVLLVLLTALVVLLAVIMFICGCG